MNTIQDMSPLQHDPAPGAKVIQSQSAFNTLIGLKQKSIKSQETKLASVGYLCFFSPSLLPESLGFVAIFLVELYNSVGVLLFA